MDTTWATTELAWTAHPETGVSLLCVCACVRTGGAFKINPDLLFDMWLIHTKLLLGCFTF